MGPYVNDAFTEKRLSAADSAVFLEQFVGVTPSIYMYFYWRCTLLVPVDGLGYIVGIQRRSWKAN